MTTFHVLKKKKKSNTICLEIYYHCCYYLGLIENLYLRPLYIVFVYRGLSCYENLEVFTYFFVSSSDFQDVTQLWISMWFLWSCAASIFLERFETFVFIMPARFFSVRKQKSSWTQGDRKNEEEMKTKRKIFD